MKRFKLYLFVFASIFLFNDTYPIYANDVNISTISAYNSLENELSKELQLLNEEYTEFDFKILN